MAGSSIWIILIPAFSKSFTSSLMARAMSLALESGQKELKLAPNNLKNAVLTKRRNQREHEDTRAHIKYKHIIDCKKLLSVLLTI